MAKEATYYGTGRRKSSVARVFITPGTGNMTINGSNGGGGIVGDMMGLGLGMAAAGAVAPQLNNMFNGMNTANNEAASAPAAKCAKCGADLPDGAKFCLECGEKL